MGIYHLLTFITNIQIVAYLFKCHNHMRQSLDRKVPWVVQFQLQPLQHLFSCTILHIFSNISIFVISAAVSV